MECHTPSVSPTPSVPRHGSYYVKLHIVSETLGALHPHQNGLLQLSAEAHSQPVCPRARTVIRGPRVRDEGSSTAEDVGSPS